ASGFFYGLRLGASEVRVADTTSAPIVNGAGGASGIQGPDGSGSTATAWTINATPQIGYQWFVLHSGFYLRPWLGANIAVLPGGPVSTGDRAWSPRVFTPTGGLHLGFEI